METDWSFNQYELALSACAASLSVSDVAQLVQVARAFSEKQIIEMYAHHDSLSRNFTN